MRTQSALSYLYNAVVAFFATFATAGAYGALTVTGAGTATIGAGSTAPASDYDVRVRFTQGGTVGSPGIQYVASLDGGVTYDLNPTDLGVANVVVVSSLASGVSINLGAGTVLANELVSFQTEGPRKQATIVVGERSKVAQINQGPGGANRIVIQPGDDGGKDGEFLGVRGPGPKTIVPPPLDNTTTAQGTQVRRISDWNRLFMISVWACDPARPRDDLPSYEACERLLEDFMQAVTATYPAHIAWGAPTWTRKTVDTEYGREIRVPLAIRSTMFDLPESTVTPSPVVTRPNH